MASASKTRTLQVVCPFWLSEDDTVTLDLNDLGSCTCTGCDAEFSAEEAAAKFAALAERWGAVAKWIDAAPVV